MNERIATWSPVSPPADWATVRVRWTRWNHVRTTAAVLSFALYLAAVASFGS
ncbi:anthrone oxygenase family protein [Halomicroarcula sp. GCM10025817]|uniref:anthrone oxygenase family protein n=1 Tax=Haloarcula TaxID=2237 RepID=UPI00360C628B